MPDGDAKAIREFAKENLRCFFPDCPRPEFKTVSRSRKRDGFSHLAGASKHAPESVNHLQGKAVIAEWLRTLFGSEAVAVEAPTSTHRPQVADVMLILPEGQRVAFEVQYSSLSISEWKARHQSYVDQGIVDVWLWGHTRLKAANSNSAELRFPLEDVQDEVRQSGSPVYFLNPETSEIAIATSTWESSTSLAFDQGVNLAVSSLHRFTVSTNGLESPELQSLRRAFHNREGFLQAQERDRHRNAELQREQGTRVEAERIARYERDRKERERERQDIERKWQSRTNPIGPEASESMATGGPWTNCRSCAGVLDPVHRNIGFHSGPCDPNWRNPLKRVHH